MDSNYKIYFGAVDSPFLSFDYNSIEDINFDNSVDIIGDELSSDTMEFALFFDDANGTLRNTQYGTPVFLCNGDTLIGKYFFEKAERTAVKRYKVYTASLIGLIGREEYYGGFFAQARFEDVLNNILFSNGFSTKIYKVYKPQNLGTGRGEKMTSASGSTDTYKQRLQASLVINGYPWTTGVTSASNYAIGYGTRYGLYIYEYRADDDSPTYYKLQFYYGGSRKIYLGDDPLIGDGSRVIIDANPLAGYIKMTVEYVKYDDPTTTGVLEETVEVAVSTSTQITSLDCAFGPGYTSGSNMSYNFLATWDYYRVYNADGTPRIDAGLAYDEDANRYYVFNRVNGFSTQTTNLTAYGEQLGVIGDLTRGGRDFELSSSIEYGFGVAASLVNGWLPISTRREALHQLLFSQNVSLIKSADGKLMFTGITNGTPTAIADDDIFDDNTEEPIAEARQISVTEHSYTVPSGSAEVIFDNTDSAAITGDYMAIFDNAPIYGTPTGSGITIRQFNCNAALVSGRGTISGTPYVYAKHEQKYQNSGVYDGADVSVSNITLITASNSDNIMNKLKAYYAAGLKKIGIGIVYRSQRCGIRYSFKTLFENLNIGHLAKVSARASSFVRADCDFVSGYIPPSSGGYGNYQIVDYDGEWAVPSAVRTQEYPNIRLILIGPGHDGTAGANGANGEDAYIVSAWENCKAGDGGTGGDAGVGGEGGKIYQITIDATNVAKITAEKSGYHTVVKTYNDSDTLLNTYTSNSGNTAEGGITNDFTGDIYARHGKDGVKGGDGGKGGGGVGSAPSSGNGTDVSVSYRVNPYKGGKGKERVNNAWTSTRIAISYYGGGGGAAEGSNGGDTYVTSTTSLRTYTAGGNGANAVTNPNFFTGYGSGGFGGSGGGGGGGAGMYYRSESDTTSYVAQTPGNGGTGSAGTTGIDGCLLIYY